MPVTIQIISIFIFNDPEKKFIKRYKALKSSLKWCFVMIMYLFVLICMVLLRSFPMKILTQLPNVILT